MIIICGAGILFLVESRTFLIFHHQSIEIMHISKYTSAVIMNMLVSSKYGSRAHHNSFIFTALCLSFSTIHFRGNFHHHLYINHAHPQIPQRCQNEHAHRRSISPIPMDCPRALLNQPDTHPRHLDARPPEPLPDAVHWWGVRTPSTDRQQRSAGLARLLLHGTRTCLTVVAAGQLVAGVRV
jgi:hypothetical protein